MGTNFYKAVRPDGTDFNTGSVNYAAVLGTGEVIRHPTGDIQSNDAADYLSVSVESADCTGFSWPCRLFRVEPVGDIADSGGGYKNKRRVSALRVVEELPAWHALGPNGEQVAALIDRIRSITPDEALRLDAAWDVAWAAARSAAWDAAWAARSAARASAQDAAWSARVAAQDAAWDAAWDVAWAAARASAQDAAWALVARDLITPEAFAILTGPWASVMGATWDD